MSLFLNRRWFLKILKTHVAKNLKKLDESFLRNSVV